MCIQEGIYIFTSKLHVLENLARAFSHPLPEKITYKKFKWLRTITKLEKSNNLDIIIHLI